MNADTKRGLVRILDPVIMPSRFLFSCALVVRAFCLRPDRLTYEEFGIRVVAMGKDDRTSDDRVKVYAALELLRQHDKEKLELIKKHIRTIYLWSGETGGPSGWKRQSGGFYMGTGVCFLNLRLFPADLSGGNRAVTIIGWLVFEASKVEFAGKFGVYFPLSEEVQSRCTEEHRRTVQKFCDESS